MNPVDYFNLNNEWEDIIHPPKFLLHKINEKTYSCNPKGIDFFIDGHYLTVAEENELNIPVGKQFSKFQWVTMHHYNGKWKAHIADI